MKRITIALPAPYVGLRAFTERESLLFFGRDNHVRELLTKLERTHRFIAVLGASGTGKSSLVRAGLVPALHRGALASAGYSWNVCIFKPGDAPLNNLARALTTDPRWLDGREQADAASSLSAFLAASPLALVELYAQKASAFGRQALLLVVDQFEEIFRYRQQSVDEAEAFIRLLLRSASEDVPIHIVITMRSDFLGHCVAFFGLPEAINSGIFLTPRLEPQQLKSVIASPLALVGGEIDPVLVNTLVNTLEGEDELPILEHALLRMWNRARLAGRTRIEPRDFEAVCSPVGSTPRSGDDWSPMPGQSRLSVAIDNHASEIYADLQPRSQLLARQLFLALVERRDGRHVRRPRILSELVEQIGEHDRNSLLDVISAFRADHVGFLLPPARETTLGDDSVIDISHESLFRQWHLLRQWLAEEELDVAELTEWRHRAIMQKKGGGWLDASDCDRALRWRARVQDRANPKAWARHFGDADTYSQVSAYVQASLDHLARERAERERLEREANEARERSLEAEAEVQRQAAAQAEIDREKAEHFAEAMRRRSTVATAFAFAAVLLGLVAFILFLRANHMANSAVAGELVASAETLASSSPDETVLVGLAARRISPAARADALIRATRAAYSYKTVLRGHDAQVLSSHFSPDGKTIVTASSDGTARLWDSATGKQVHVLRGHEDWVLSAQFSPNGKAIVTIARGEPARLWDAATGKELHVLRGHQAPVVTAQFSPAGTTIVTASSDKTARLWDATTGKQVNTLRGHAAPISSAQFSPDSKTILTASSDKTARLWDAATGKQLHVLRGHEKAVWSAEFSGDGKTLVTTSSNEARLWDASSGKELHVLRGHEDQISNAEFSPDGSMILTAAFDSEARVWEAATGRQLHVLRGHQGWVWSARFSADGKTIVTASWDKTARLWNTATGSELHVFRGHEDRVWSARFSPDGKTIITASSDKTARLWDAAAGKELQVLRGHEAPVSGAQFSPDGNTIMTASSDKTARLWDAATGKELQVLRGHRAPVSSAQFSPDGNTIMTASSDKTARLWDAATGREQHVLRDHEAPVSSAEFSPDGRTIVTACSDKARLWDAATGKVLLVLRGHEAPVLTAEFSPDGKTIMSTSSDKTARLWDAATGKVLLVLRGHEAPVLSAEFSPDGKTIMSTSSDKTARLWDAATGQQLHVLRGHENAPWRARYSPDGAAIVTASLAEPPGLWDAATGKELQVLLGHEHEVSSAEFSPDGRTIVTASSDETARLWDAATGKQLHVLRGHEDAVYSAQFSPDGKTVLTASEDMTARLWACEVCRPVEEMAAELAKAVGRDLSEEERRRFGVPDWLFER